VVVRDLARYSDDAQQTPEAIFAADIGRHVHVIGSVGRLKRPSGLGNVSESSQQGETTMSNPSGLCGGRCLCGGSVYYKEFAPKGTLWQCASCGATWQLLTDLKPGRPAHMAFIIPPPGTEAEVGMDRATYDACMQRIEEGACPSLMGEAWAGVKRNRKVVILASVGCVLLGVLLGLIDRVLKVEEWWQ
jgi:hypothetical protein